MYAKENAAQPDMLWKTHDTKPEAKSIRVIMLLCLLEV